MAKISKMDYLVETYLPIVLEGEDFSKFKSPDEIYYYIRPYVEQITADDENIQDINVYDLASDIAYRIFSMQKMKGHRHRAPTKKCKFVCPEKMF